MAAPAAPPAAAPGGPPARPRLGKAQLRAVGRALGTLGHYRWQALGAGASLLLVAAANLLAPQAVRVAVDQGLAQGRRDVVGWAVAGLVALAVARGLFNFLQGYLAERASQGVAFDLRGALFARIQRLSFSYYDRAQTGELLTRLTNDVEQVRTFVGSGVVQLGASLVMLLGGAAVLLAINPLLAVAALLAIAPILLLLRRFVARMGPLFGRLQGLLGKLNVVLQESLRGVRVVRAFSAEEREAARYRALNEQLADQNVEVVRTLAGNFPFVNFFGNLGTLVVVGVGGALVFADRLTLGELLAFVSYLGFLLQPLLMLGFLAAMLSRAGTSAERIYELLDTAVEVADRPGATVLGPIEGRVELEDVRFRYAGAQEELLKGLSFTVEPGQLVAILGTTGSGKSTVVNLIPRFYDVTGGSVLVDGHDVRDVTLASLRSQVGVVLQEALLFSGTVRDNIAYGRPSASLEEVRAAAAAAQAAAFIEALPQGYETVIGERGVGLSGGQRQRLAIARALLTAPKVLILDDSTSAVDAETEAAIQGALDALMRDARTTAIVIAQRASTVRDADLIVVLDQGRVADQGTHQELLARSELYHQILGTQLQGAPREAA